MSKTDVQKIRIDKASAAELEFQDIQLQLARIFLERLTRIPEEDQAAQARLFFDFENELNAAQLKILGAQGVATAEQKDLIDEAFGAEINTLNADILEFTEDAGEALSGVLRGRGLEPGQSNSPALDAGVQLASEVQRQQAKGATSLRGQAAGLKAAFNKGIFDQLLGQGSGFTRGAQAPELATGGALSDIVSAGLGGLRNVRVGGNKTISSIPSGLSITSQFIGDLTNFLGSSGAGAAAGAAIGSSKDIKDHKESIDASEILERIRKLQIEKWRYTEEDGIDHIGPYAEDFQREFGLGDSDKTIHLVDLGGIALAGIQELADRLDMLMEERKKAA